jgi:hypothetical protein
MLVVFSLLKLRRKVEIPLLIHVGSMVIGLFPTILVILDKNIHLFGLDDIFLDNNIGRVVVVH